jgi:hypothetical protein
MFKGKYLTLNLEDHLILRMGKFVRRRYIVDSFSPGHTTAVVRAADVGYHPTYTYAQDDRPDPYGDNARVYGFADRYRIRSTYGELRAEPLGVNRQERQILPYTTVVRPIDDQDGRMAGDGRNITYGMVSHESRASEIGASLHIYGARAGDECHVDVNMVAIDGQITLIVHVTEGVRPDVRVVELHP